MMAPVREFYCVLIGRRSNPPPGLHALASSPALSSVMCQPSQPVPASVSQRRRHRNPNLQIVKFQPASRRNCPHSAARSQSPATPNRPQTSGCPDRPGRGGGLLFSLSLLSVGENRHWGEPRVRVCARVCATYCTSSAHSRPLWQGRQGQCVPSPERRDADIGRVDVGPALYHTCQATLDGAIMWLSRGSRRRSSHLGGEEGGGKEEGLCDQGLSGTSDGIRTCECASGRRQGRVFWALTIQKWMSSRSPPRTRAGVDSVIPWHCALDDRHDRHKSRRLDESLSVVIIPRCRA